MKSTRPMTSQLVTVAMIVAFMSAACGGSLALSTDGTGGTEGGTSSAMAADAGGDDVAVAVSCSNVTPCGGSLVGTWTVTSSCLVVSGNLDLLPWGLGCASAPITGAYQVSGTWSANANGTYADDTITTGDEQVQMDAACLNISGTRTTCEQLGTLFGAVRGSPAACSSAAGGGCSCSTKIKQAGGIGSVTGDPSTSGEYTAFGNVVTADSQTTSSYCISGDTMTWIPRSMGPSITGAIVFHR